jgi:hypothetical protein
MSTFNFQTGIFSSFTPKNEFSVTPSREKRRKKEKKNVLSYRHSLESKNREKRWVMGEHLKQIKHLNRRVGEIGSMIERKKKAYDMIGHPVLFLRGKSQKDPRLKPEFLERVLKRPEKIQVYEETIKTSKSFSGHNNKEKQVKELSNMLLDIIVQRRIYKNKDLHEFFENIKLNCVLDKNWIEDAIEIVLNRLEI